MAKAVVNPAAQLTPRSEDAHLSLEQLATLEVFQSLKKTPAFAKFPGSYILRFYRAGEVICRAGEAGGSAFYMLSGRDVDSLSQMQSAGGADATMPSLATSPQDFSRLLDRARVAMRDAAAGDDKHPCRVATARLSVDAPNVASVRNSQSRGWLRRASSTDPGPATQPALIANDGPSDIDYVTRKAAIQEGEVFGEMSCLTRQPRSATVVADMDCFSLEILRNILDQMRKDPEYKQLTDKKYRERVLEGHLRQLSIFRLLTDAEFQLVRDHVELVEYAAGAVIWDEGDESGSLCVVRSGIVQVVQSYPWRLVEKSITDWQKLLDVLGGKTESNPALQRLATSLPKSVQETIATSTMPPSADVARTILNALNCLAKSDVLLLSKEMQPAMSDDRFVRETALFPGKVKVWSSLQIRRATRALYHVLCPGAVAPPEPIGLSRVLQYLGRGNIFGEISLLLRQPHSATCIAYAHPDADRDSTNVEIVRVPAEIVHQLTAQSPRIQAEISAIAEARRQRDRTSAKSSESAVFQSRRVEDLGLQQGQNLMLIDLDRCTRCGECVQACIATHDDGFSRLYLDGPRYGKYLIPSSCRLCRDPVCMIGCPVGSIQQGASGEVMIRDWCIGCGVCASQCPYDSIQMHDTAIVRSGAPGWFWTHDLDKSLPAHWNEARYRPSKWHAATAPVHWGIDVQQSIAAFIRSNAGQPAVKKLYFRLQFDVTDQLLQQSQSYELTATSQSNSLEVYVNGQPLELTQDAAQKKRGVHVATIPQTMLHSRDNTLAACVEPPNQFGALILDVRLDRNAPEGDDFEEKHVEERAVVCDQCSSLSGNRHACVYACPHEAAFRVDAWTDLPSM